MFLLSCFSYGFDVNKDKNLSFYLEFPELSITLQLEKVKDIYERFVYIFVAMWFDYSIGLTNGEENRIYNIWRY